MQGQALELGAALPSLVPLPEFKCLNPRDRLWEIKVKSLFNLYIKRKCFYNNCSLLKSDRSNLIRELRRKRTKYRILLRGQKPKLRLNGQETSGPGDLVG